uniref:Phosphatidate cytidylyltransferase n=1 Tax=Heterorhabditis bacteriophora TaxID=37862 RepID=A0A1I7WPJ4_HETBA
MVRLLNQEELESESLISSPSRVPPSSLSNRRGFQVRYDPFYYVVEFVFMFVGPYLWLLSPCFWSRYSYFHFSAYHWEKKVRWCILLAALGTFFPIFFQNMIDIIIIINSLLLVIYSSIFVEYPQRFSLEEASYYFPLKTMWRSFFCALIAGIILRIVNPFGSDQTSLFHVDYMMKWTFVELIPFAGLGIPILI